MAENINGSEHHGLQECDPNFSMLIHLYLDDLVSSFLRNVGTNVTKLQGITLVQTVVIIYTGRERSSHLPSVITGRKKRFPL